MDAEEPKTNDCKDQPEDDPATLTGEGGNRLYREPGSKPDTDDT